MMSVSETTHTPEIRASVQGDLHQGANHLPGDTVGAPPDAGRKYQHHPGDAEQPIQASPLGNGVHAPYKYIA